MVGIIRTGDTRVKPSRAFVPKSLVVSSVFEFADMPEVTLSSRFFWLPSLEYVRMATYSIIESGYFYDSVNQQGVRVEKTCTVVS